MGTKRRAVLSGSLLLGGGAFLNAATAACSGKDPAPQASAGTSPTGSSSSRVLLAYFSRAGENYWYGGTRDIAVGNTQIVAEMIASLVRVDVYRIQAADPYPQNYRATVDRNVAEQNSDARPAIAGTLPDTSGYDVVLLGSGIWNVRPPMIMRTFAGSVDLAGKTIQPFVTYAVSGLGSRSRTTPGCVRTRRSGRAWPYEASRQPTPGLRSRAGCAISACAEPSHSRGRYCRPQRPSRLEQPIRTISLE